MTPLAGLLLSSLLPLAGLPSKAPVQERPGQAAPTGQRSSVHEVRGAAFVVRCHWRSEAALDGYARAVSEVLEAVAAQSELELRADVAPLAVHVHESPRALAQEELPGASERWLSERAVVGGAEELHIALQPRVLDRVHARLGTSPLLLRRAALHGAALLRRERGPQVGEAEVDPSVVRGLELAWAERALRATHRARAAAAEPAVSAGRARLAALLAGGTTPMEALGRAPVDGRFGAALDAADAARLAVGEALLDGEPDLPSVDEWLTGAAAARLTALGEEAVLRVEQIVRAAAEERLWREVTPASFAHPARLAEDGSYADVGGLVQWATRVEDALLLARERIEAPRFRILGTLEPHALEPGLAAQMDVAFGAKGGDDAERFLCVFNTREGTWVFRREPGTGEYQQVCGDPALRPRAGEPSVFEVRVEGDLVSVGLDGVPMRPGRASGLDLTGSWGLGVHAGSAGIWRGVRWEPLED